MIWFIIIGVIVAIVGALILVWAIPTILKWTIIFFLAKLLLDQKKKEKLDLVAIMFLIGAILVTWRVMGVVLI